MGSINTLISVVQRSMFTGQEALNMSFWVPTGCCASLGVYEPMVRFAFKNFHTENSKSFSKQPLSSKRNVAKTGSDTID